MATPTTYTTKLLLTKPGSAAVNWGDSINDNFDALDKHLPSIVAEAGEDLPAYGLVAFSGGLLYKADTDHATEARRIAVGITDSATTVTTGDDATVFHWGFFDYLSTTLSADQDLYLSSTAGWFSATPAYYTDGSFQLIGRSVATDKILFHPYRRTLPTMVECENPVQYKDGGNNPAGSFAWAWDNTDERSYYTITFDASSQDIDLWYTFELPQNFLAIPNNSYTAFQVEGKVSNATASIAIAEIIDTAGGNITSGMPSANQSTSVAAMTLQGSVFNGGTYAAGGKVRIRLRMQNNAASAYTASVTMATLRVPCKPF